MEAAWSDTKLTLYLYYVGWVSDYDLLFILFKIMDTDKINQNGISYNQTIGNCLKYISGHIAKCKNT